MKGGTYVYALPMHTALHLDCGQAMKAWFVPPIVVPAAIAIAVAVIAILSMRWGSW